MAKQIILTQNNFGIPIELQLVSNTNSPIDLTDKTVEVAISYDGTIIDVLQATISSYTNGTAYIVTTTRHTSNAGLYTTFWSVKDKYGYITAQSDLYYYVKEEYNGAEPPSIEQNKGTIEEEFDKVNSSIEILDKKNSGISAKVSELETKVSEQLEHATIIMPPPSTVDINTKNLQNILDKAKDKKINLTVQFLSGYYELNSCFIYDNTTIKMTNKTILKNVETNFTNPVTQINKNIPILFMNAKPYDGDDSSITGYNGRSNIIIDGGILDTISALLLCHGQNIIIKNVTFKNCNSDHYIQIGGCKNVKIQNCKFIGTTERDSSRNYVEFIQIDWLTEKAQPYWVSDASIFDSTVNDGIEIDGCEFVTGNGDYDFMYTCVGSHSSDGDNKNKNIVIRNCKFTGYSYYALTIDKMTNVIIDNNIFTDTKATCAINISNSDNVSVNSNNRIKGGKRGIFCSTSSNVKIDGVLIEEVNADSDFILIGESSNVELNRINFINCNTLGNNVLIRNCSDVNADSCRDVNTTATDGYFFRVYTKNEGVSERIRIKNTITSNKKEYRMSNANAIISSIEEELWSGNATTGEISLRDNLDKFKNLKIYIRFYGDIIKDLNFINNVAVVKDFNLNDDTSQLSKISFMEIKLTLDTNKITINHNNQVEMSNGVNTFVSSNVTIFKITGERIYY